MKLSVKKINELLPQDKRKKYFDGRGLFLEVTPKGSKLWRLKYRYNGIEKCISLGDYPTVPLSLARKMVDKYRLELIQGKDPKGDKEKDSLDKVTFDLVTKEYLDKKESVWSKSHYKCISELLSRDVLPQVGSVPINKLTVQDILKVLNSIENKGAVYTAHRASNYFNQICGYAVITGRLKFNPAIGLTKALKQPRKKHFAAFTEPKDVSRLLKAMDGFEGTLVVKSALLLAPLVFVRPGELRHAKWVDVDFDKNQWRYLVTKTNTEHIVPLSKQSVKILQDLHPLTGEGEFLFPSQKTNTRPLSDNGIRAALRTLGFSNEEMTVHGFRAMARTLLDEELGFRVDLIEHQLSHSVKDPLGRAYNRTKHLKERTEMMQAWADYLDKLRTL